MERFKLINSIYLILVRDEKILLLKRKNTGFMDGFYGLPSGHLEDNETLTAGLVREVQEEIGIAIKQDDVKLVHVMHRRMDDIRVDFFFETSSYNGIPTNNEPEKSDDVQWFPLDDLPKNIIPYIKVALQNSINKIIYSEFGWEK